jgi:hypothetical protein
MHVRGFGEEGEEGGDGFFVARDHLHETATKRPYLRKICHHLPAATNHRVWCATLSTPKTSPFGLKIKGSSGSVLNVRLPKKTSPEKV